MGKAGRGSEMQGVEGAALLRGPGLSASLSRPLISAPEGMVGEWERAP